MKKYTIKIILVAIIEAAAILLMVFYQKTNGSPSDVSSTYTTINLKLQNQL